jgi:hypothetical protein
MFYVALDFVCGSSSRSSHGPNPQAVAMFCVALDFARGTSPRPKAGGDAAP